MKTKLNFHPGAEQGSALLTVLFFVMLIGLAAGSMGVMVRGDLFMNKRMVNAMKAQEIADGAAHRAIAYAAANMDNLTLPPSEVSSGTMGDGVYTVTVSHLGSGIYGLIAQGVVQDVTRTVKVFVRKPDYSLGLQRGIFANGDIIGQGNGTVENGTHSNEDTGLAGSIEIVGDSSASKLVTMKGAAKVSGTVTSNAPRLPFPKLDYDYYYSIADVYMGDTELKGTYSPTNGIIWVVGDVKITGKTVINGSLFATGNIEVFGRKTVAQITGTTSTPAMVSRDGYINFQGKSRVDGLVYTSSGSVYINGTLDVIGSVVAFGNVECYGNWGQIDYLEQDPELEEDDRVEILAWEY